jgi:hypothetical protein
VLKNVNITGAWTSAGLVSETAYEGSILIENCSTSGSVIGDRFVGGLVALHYHGVIKNCKSSCTVAGVSRAVGGLVGHNQATFEFSWRKRK